MVILTSTHGSVFLTFEFKNIWKTIEKHLKISRLKYARSYLRNGRYAPAYTLCILYIYNVFRVPVKQRETLYRLYS